MKKLLILILLLSVITSYAQFDTKTISDPNLTYRGAALDPAGDVDSDGIPDYIAGAWLEDATNKNNAGKAYIISGSNQSIVRTLVSPFPEIEGWFGYSVASGIDLNGDGKFDFVVGAPGETSASIAKAGRVHVFSGSDGSLLYTLNSPSPITNGQFGNAVLIQNDFDGVGGPEIVVSAYQENGQTAAAAGRVHIFNRNIFRNTIFSSAQEENGGFGWRIASTEDFLGTKALVVSAIFENPGTSPANSGALHVYNMTNASGTFISSLQDTSPTIFGNFGYSIVSYINPSNNKSELLVMDVKNRVVNLNTTGGLIKSSSSFAANITAGKFDRNNIPDFATTSDIIYNSFNYTAGTKLGTDGLFLYDIGFGDAITTLGDVDNDGVNELVAFSSSSGSSYIALNQLNSNLSGAPNGFDRKDVANSPFSFASFVSIGDLDNDTRPDIVAVNINTNTIGVFRNTTVGSSITCAPVVEFPVGINPTSVSIVDLDGDGKADLVVTNSNTPSISVLRNISAGAGNISFAAKVDYTVGFYPYSIVSADFDNDGKKDLAVANGGQISILRNISTGIASINFASKVDIGEVSSQANIAVGDLDGDNRPDLAGIGNAAFVSVFRNSSTAAGVISFEAQKDYGITGGFSLSVAIGDIDGDGKKELAVSNYESNTVSVFKNTSTGIGNINYDPKIDFSTGGRPSSVSIGNLDADGKADLVVANSEYSASSVSVFRNTRAGIGTISLAAKEDYTVGYSPRSVALGDLNGDNLPDIATANSGNNSISILQNLATPPLPTITSFTPASGSIGTSVIVTGSNFDINPTNNILSFNGTVAVVTMASATQLTVTVPSGATTGPISITVGGQKATSSQLFTFLKASQSVTFAALPTKTFGDANFALSATASSQLPITFTSSNTAVATVSGSTVTIVGVGTSTITASQAGNDLFAAAANVTQTLTVNKANQSITFTTLADKTLGDAPFALTGATSSNLSVSYAPSSDKITINSSQVTLVKAGRVSIVASQAGNDNFNAATNVTQGFCVKPKKPNITSASSTGTIILTSDATAGNQWYLDEKAVSGAINQTLSVAASGVYKVQVQIDDCFSEFSADQLAIITGDIEQETSVISISPNPVESVLQISGIIEEVKSTQLLDMTGRATSSLILEKNHDVYQTRIEHLSPGGYLLRILFFDRVEQVRFIKK